MNIDWKRKLTSRKLWMSVATFVSMLLIYFGHAESEAAQVASLIMAGATVISYVIGEGLADSRDEIHNLTFNGESKKDDEVKPEE